MVRSPFAYHATLQDHVIKSLYEFKEGVPEGKSPSYQIGGHRHCGKDIMVLVYHLISQDHVMERPRG